MQEQFVIGQHYWRPCAEIMTIPDGKIYYIPIFDHLHTDVQFGFPHEHYHIDGRFEMEPRMKQHFNCWDGYTAAVIVPDRPTSHSFLSVCEIKVRCVRTDTGLKIPENPNEEQVPKIERYHHWYQSYIGKKCEGRRCPHFGTAMLENNGALVCPMHNLTADLNTLLVVDPARIERSRKR